MRYAIAISILAALGWLALHQNKSELAAGLVFQKAASMERLAGDEGGEIGYGIVASRFPFTPEAVDARRCLFALRAQYPEVGVASAVAPSLRDSLWSRGDPYVGALTLAVLAAIISLHLLLQTRSRTRGRAFLLLLLIGGAMALTQTGWGHGVLGRSGAADVYAVFPWIAAGALLLSVLLMLVRRSSLMTRRG